jgi:drug/metabolite transporter (DMT)-like permease
LSRKALFIFVSLGMIWGSSFPIIKLALRGLSPFDLVLVRVATAALVMAAVAASRGELFRGLGRLTKIEILSLVGGGLCSYALPYLLLTYGESHVSASMAGMLNSTTPIFTVLLTPLFFRAGSQSLRTYVGVAVGLLGVSIVLEPWRTHGGTSDFRYELAVLSAAALYGVGILVQKRFLLPTALSSIQIAAYQLIVSLVVYVSVGVADQRALVALDVGRPLVFAVVLGVVNTAIAGLLALSLTRLVTATVSSTVTYLIAVVAVLAGTVFLGEPITFTFVVGALITFLGLYSASEAAAVPSFLKLPSRQ